ncbi:hypothetical protein [Anaerosalibacter sp. Marseille-P3206]|uniref:hypothetical protein n=1 Tax=Anaerosalibacter sp. Marseille-P3206 TaxID=1871005 RepID=UPI00098728C1|nr:hypothetical protein [Anaerosalibacter sp. Marseille-P3206]
MNKKAEELLSKNQVAKRILSNKSFYEKQIVKYKKLEKKDKDDFVKGLDSGVQIGFKSAAYNCKILLDSMLVGEVN